MLLPSGASGGWVLQAYPTFESGWSQGPMSLVMGIDQSYLMAPLFFFILGVADACFVRNG
ncbi:MAG: hypothetical protein ACLR8Y_00410 [Alistipes indistinctus]